LLLTVALVLAGLAVAASAQEKRLAFTLGVSPDDEVVTLTGAREACQQPIDVAAPFDVVSFPLAVEEGEPSPPLAVEVRSLPHRRPLGRGRLPGGSADDASWNEVAVGRVAAGRRVAVCLLPLGEGSVGLYGGPSQAARTSTVTVSGERRPRDLTLVFLTERPRATLSLVPDMLERAALWRPRPVSPALLGVLLAGVAVLAPLLLGRALAATAEPSGPQAGGRPRDDGAWT
jgi:hypothetical protein